MENQTQSQEEVVTRTVRGFEVYRTVTDRIAIAQAWGGGDEKDLIVIDRDQVPKLVEFLLAAAKEMD
jgi:hypothetical protein